MITISPIGYANEAYARALAEFGEPLELSRCQGWLLRRAIPGTPYSDAMGSYPLFACQNWTGLAEDLSDCNLDLVSVALVPDPFGDWELPMLKSCFDQVVHFKDHFVVDLGQQHEQFVSKHHRYYARQALRELTVEPSVIPLSHLDEWVSLYSTLIRRHKLVGIKAFSRRAFAEQLVVPGLVMLRALKGDECVAAHLWFVQGGIAYSHLMAMSDAGYALNASYGLYWEAIRMFAQGRFGAVRWLNIGAGAGAGKQADDGLTKFKRGWSNTSRPAYFCGKVLKAAIYKRLTEELSSQDTAYFPAYRQRELA